MAGNEGKPPDRADPDELEGDIFATKVRLTPDQADKLLRSGEYDFGDRPRIVPSADGTATLDLFVSRAQVEALEAGGLTVEIGTNQSARARARLAEIPEGDRYQGGRVTPRGIGRKIPAEHGKDRDSRSGTERPS
jgi:hypothetical protein